MVSRQINFDGEIVKVSEDINEIVDMKGLMHSLIDAEDKYMRKKFDNEMIYYELMLTEDWDSINQDRKEKGLPKLGNQDMKKAYLKYMMVEDYKEEKYLELEYLRFQKMYDVAMKLGFDIL